MNFPCKGNSIESSKFCNPYPKGTPHHEWFTHQKLKRSEVPVAMTWDLTTIFATEEAWEAAFKQVQDSLGKFAAFKGRLGRSGRILLEALTLSDEVGAIMGRLYLYAHLSSDVDTTVSHFAGLKQRALKLDSQLDTETSWMVPELLRIKPERLEKFIEKNAGLAVYAQMFRVLQRKAAHVRSPEVEELLASAGVALGAPSTIHDQLDDADMKLPKVTLPSGEEADLSHGNFVDFYLRSQDPEVRRKGFEAMMGAYRDVRHTQTACYAGSVASNIFQAPRPQVLGCAQPRPLLHQRAGGGLRQPAQGDRG